MVEIRTHWPNVGKCKQRDDKTDALRYKSFVARSKMHQMMWHLAVRHEVRSQRGIESRDSGRGV